MATVSLTAGTWTAGFASGDLNSLANGAQKTSSLTAPQVDNTAGNLYAQVEVNLGALSPATGGHVIAVLVPEIAGGGGYASGTDGTTAADQVRWQNFPHAVLALRGTAATAQVQRSRLLEVANERYRLVLINRAGSALAASGNQLSWRLVSEVV